MHSIGWGILGPGGIAGTFTRDLAATRRRVAAVGGRDAGRAAAFAREHTIPHSHGSWRGLVEDPSVDVVYVATPQSSHAEAALLAIAAGKHVLVEKPFTMHEGEARQVADAAASAGVVLLEAMWTRFLPHMLEIRDRIRCGEIGTPLALQVDHQQLLPADPAFRLNDPKLGGGALLDLGVYPISFAVDLFGIPERIEAVTAFTSTGVDARTSGVLVHTGGAQTIFTTALNLAGPNRAEIIGTGGRIAVDPVWYSASGYTVYDTDQRVVASSRPAVAGRGMEYEAFEMERLIRAGARTSPMMPAGESVKIMGLLDTVRERIGLRYPADPPVR